MSSLNGCTRPWESCGDATPTRSQQASARIIFLSFFPPARPATGPASRPGPVWIHVAHRKMDWTTTPTKGWSAGPRGGPRCPSGKHWALPRVRPHLVSWIPAVRRSVPGGDCRGPIREERWSNRSQCPEVRLREGWGRRWLGTYRRLARLGACARMETQWR